MLNQERIQKNLEKLPVQIYIYFCPNDGRFRTIEALESCPLCQRRVKLLKTQIELREVILSCCPLCHRAFQKETIECQNCHQKTVPVLKQS